MFQQVGTNNYLCKLTNGETKRINQATAANSSWKIRLVERLEKCLRLWLNKQVELGTEGMGAKVLRISLGKKMSMSTHS